MKKLLIAALAAGTVSVLAADEFTQQKNSSGNFAATGVPVALQFCETLKTGAFSCRSVTQNVFTDWTPDTFIQFVTGYGCIHYGGGRGYCPPTSQLSAAMGSSPVMFWGQTSSADSSKIGIIYLFVNN